MPGSPKKGLGDPLGGGSPGGRRPSDRGRQILPTVTALSQPKGAGSPWRSESSAAPPEAQVKLSRRKTAASGRRVRGANHERHDPGVDSTR
jgi:hypothetical protein